VNVAGATGTLVTISDEQSAAKPIEVIDPALCAFDRLELDGEDLRRIPIETRKLTLKSLLHGKHTGIAFNEHFTADGAIVYRHACALGCEGIVSKRLGSAYRSGHADCWVKIKNPAAPAVTREAEEDWDRRGELR
jgi:ATP-dependent DNA ligase